VGFAMRELVTGIVCKCSRLAGARWMPLAERESTLGETGASRKARGLHLRGRLLRFAILPCFWRNCCPVGNALD
jgi:hypothetical protein